MKKITLQFFALTFALFLFSHPNVTFAESTTCNCNLVLDGVDGNGGNCKIGSNKVSIDIGDGSGEMIFVNDLFKDYFGQQAIKSHCYPLRKDNRQVQNILNARENNRIESPVITKDNCGNVQDEISVADFTAPQNIGGYDGVYGLHLTGCSLDSKISSSVTTHTKEECELEKNRVLASCLNEISPDLPEEQKIPARTECNTSASATYRECEKHIPDGVIEKDESAGYDIPKAEAASLNQFQGLTAQQVIGNLMATAMKIIGSIAFAMMVFAGFLWMTAAGNSDREKKARDIMVWSALGVIVILSSYSLVKLVLDAFTN